MGILPLRDAPMVGAEGRAIAGIGGGLAAVLDVRVLAALAAPGDGVARLGPAVFGRMFIFTGFTSMDFATPVIPFDLNPNSCCSEHALHTVTEPGSRLHLLFTFCCE